MAGKPGRSGGPRVKGSGSKGLSVREQWLRWQPGSAPGVLPGERGQPVPMPEGLPAEVAAVWVRLAPLALAEGTLAPTTAYAFELLCKGVVLEAQLAADADRRGGTDHRGIWARLEVSLGRFRLTADGQPLAAGAAPVRPLSELERLQAESTDLRRPMRVT
jgi:hypothetical protein